MKHFSDDGCNAMPDYDKGMLNYEPDDDYDRSMSMHYGSQPEDWYEGTRHFDCDCEVIPPFDF
jgi:hypothetical protein